MISKQQQNKNKTTGITGWDNDFLPVIRTSIGYLLVFQLIFTMLVFILHYDEGEFVFYRILPAVLLSLVFLYLYLPSVKRTMARWYIIGFIALLTIFPYLAISIFLYFEDYNSEFFVFISKSRGLPLILAGLIITAWYYRMKYALVYVVITVLLDYSINRFANIQAGDTSDLLLSNIDLRVVTFIVTAFFVAKIAEHVDNNAKALLDANSQLIFYSDTLENLAINRERSRMSRELHDTLAHSLTALTIQLEATKALLNKKPEQAAISLQTALDTARSGLTETRNALASLRSPALESKNVLEAIKDLVAPLKSAINIDIDFPESLPPLSDQTEHGIYRVVQEAIHNSMKHAGASKMSLHIQLQSDRLQVTVADNGIGIDDSKRLNGFGLTGMKERAHLAGGELTIKAAEPTGTIVSLTVPLTKDH